MRQWKATCLNRRDRSTAIEEFDSVCEDCECEEREDNLDINNEDVNQDCNEENCEKHENCDSESFEEEEVEVVSQAQSQDSIENSYLDMARRVQADFDNFRRHATENIKKAKVDGQASVIEVFLPCLDTFKEAKKSINDENVLKGVEMIENKINDTLKSLGVEKLESIGQVYDPHLHNVIAVMRDENQENDVILEEYQAGYKFNDKVLRYAKVIVNKL